MLGHNLRGGGRSVAHAHNGRKEKQYFKFNIVNFKLTFSPPTSSLTDILVVPAAFDIVQL